MKNCEGCGVLIDDDLTWCFDCELMADAEDYADDENDPYEDPNDPLYWDRY